MHVGERHKNKYKKKKLVIELSYCVSSVSLVYQGFSGCAAYLCRYDNTGTLSVNNGGILLEWGSVADQETRVHQPDRFTPPQDLIGLVRRSVL